MVRSPWSGAVLLCSDSVLLRPGMVPARVTVGRDVVGLSLVTVFASTWWGPAYYPYSCRVRLRDVYGHTCRYTKSGGTRTGVPRVHERTSEGLDERSMPTLSKDSPQGGWPWHVDLLVEYGTSQVAECLQIPLSAVCAPFPKGSNAAHSSSIQRSCT